LPTRTGGPPSATHIAIAAADAGMRSRLASLLSEEGFVGDPLLDSARADGLDQCLRPPIEVLIYAGDVTGSLTTAIQQAKQRRPQLRVVVIPSSRRLTARKALGRGVDGVIDERDLENALGPTIRTVIAGHAVAPSGRSQDLFEPALTHREKEVLTLVARGLANGQIAQRLFLSPSTIKSHLYSAFAKLGVGSRNEAAALVLDRETALGRSLAGFLDSEESSQTTRAPADGSESVTAVPLVDLGRQHAPIVTELRAAFDRVLKASSFTLGREVEQFEAEFAVYCGTDHCVGVASGTAALTLALIAAGVLPGDEVIVPAHTFIASALAVVHAGATPVLCDVDDATGLISVQCAAAAVSERTVGLIAVHLYGQVCDMAAIAALAEKHKLLVFEDAAQAHGASFDGRLAGGFGAAAAFSFYPSKNLGALGDGGAICTSDPAIAQRARQMRHLGQRAKGEHVLLGVNERLDGLQAAMLRVKLRHLDGWNLARSQCADRYRRGLAGIVGMADCHRLATSVNHVFPIRVPARVVVAEGLRERGVQTGIHYDRALHQHPAFAELPGFPAQDRLPVAEAWAREELSLPMFPELRTDEVDYVIEACRKVMDDDARAERH
jgi:dTDP-4-amino-4,6-dideoxygalactose transaminase/DNA-binding NarL/FixJ family response regulator